MTVPLHDWTARELVRAMADGRVSAVDVMEAHLDRIAALESSVHAWAFLAPEAALTAARAADERRSAGMPLPALHGLPVGVKDIIDTADMPTTYGTRVHASRRPAQDATLVARLRAAGAIVVGKTVTSEYALFVPGPTRNPHDLARTPGGSSSGSAAAVAAGMVPAALATQTNGSTIRPASFCGIVGYKPSLGLLPRTGILRQAAILDQPGLMARSVDDVALLAQALGGRDETDEQSFDAEVVVDDGHRALRIGLVRGPYWLRAERSTREAIEAFTAGAATPIEDVELPSDFATAAEVLTLIMETGIAEAYRADAETHRDLMPDLVLKTIDRGRSRSAVDLLRALQTRSDLRLRFDAIAAPYDALITPASVGIAPLVVDGTGDPLFATLWTLLGVPSISLPLLKGENGLPLGLQLVSRSRNDATLLRAAAQLLLSPPH
ncbi:amidase [Lichenifustis flavocetrariae]|uniref:Amidase n=1 Tax=Lichenifustis flavocetrariae TaxID=2949735 RepID=A0AA42CND0_9HYPH|nr:amidase [Lichenifustis flavocetrariae]MCW6509287.1 amidase [Lichenifustis flavocetrariae]